MRRNSNLWIAVLALTLVMGMGSTASAKSGISGGSFGAGVQLGFPGNGLSFNYFMSQATSIQVDATFWLDGDWSGLGARVDLLWWQSPLANFDWADLVWYLGPGANIFSFSWRGHGSHDGYVGIGAEFPIGIGFRFSKVPIDLNLEAVPVLHILGHDGTNLGFGIAGVLDARYYF